MSKEERKVPELRFKGFHDDWEQRKLGEVFKQTSKFVNPEKENLELWSLTVENGLTPKTARYNRSFLVKKNDKFKTVNNNEFIYNPMNMTLGAVDLNSTGKTVAVSGYYITMITKPNFDSKYFNFWLKSAIAIKNYKIYATGSLIERQRIQFPTLSQIKTKVPSISEQQRIGNILMKLDRIITLHQRKIHILDNMYSLFIGKIYTEKHEVVPKLRFSGYSNHWTKTTLESLLKEFSIKSNIENEYQIFSSTNSGMEFRKGRVSGSSNRGYKIIDNGDLVLSPQNLWLGNININKLGKGLVSPSYKTFSIDKVDGEFLEPQLRTKRMLNTFENVSTQGASVVRRNLDMDLFKQIIVKVPTNQEKEKIANLLNLIMNLIKHYDSKLMKLQTIKTEYLKKMFL